MGCARTALVAWLSVRSRGGSFVWRLEDLDPPRAVEGTHEAALEDLAWLGLDWDEGPDVGGDFGPYEQSKRGAIYEAALEHLHEKGLLFPCKRSRKDLRELATAPHGGPYGREGGEEHDPSEGPPAYPERWRPKDLPSGWFERFVGTSEDSSADPPDAAVRFMVHDQPVRFRDLVLGEQTQRVDLEVGDFVLKRRDGLFAYQLAVVVDDLEMGVDEVVRGAELLDSTGRQLQLVEALGADPPTYAHLPLVLNADGEKISKRDEGLTLRSLREAGARPEALVGYLAWSIGLLEESEPCRPRDLVDVFDWEKIAKDDWVLPRDLAARLA